MLVNLKEILRIAQEQKCAIGSFNVVDSVSGQAIIEAAEEKNTPVILMFAQLHKDLIDLDLVANIMLTLAKKAKVPVCVHLDHGTEIQYVKQAIDCGFSSVMYDGSLLEYEQNVEHTRSVVEYAHRNGVSVEAELGRLPNREGAGQEECLAAASDYTDPLQAQDFVGKTGVDALAIAFGTAHGIYKKKPVLNFDVIRQVAACTSVPLVMHGGSGLKEEEFRKAIALGIRKVNYFTYMSVAGAAGVRQYLSGTKEPFYHEMIVEGKAAMRKNVEEAISVFSGRT